MRGSGGADCKSAARVFVFGLDSADPDLVLQWCAEGRLPFLASLIKSGVWTRLASTSGIFSDSPWPSFNTGVHPGKHGYYNYLQLERGTTEIIRTSGRRCRYPPFWSLLRRAGKKVAVFDVPKSYPVEALDGIQVAAWGEEYPLLHPCSLPESLVEELGARFGRYRHLAETTCSRSIARELRAYDTLRANLERKLAATEFLLEQDDWDLFITVLAETHIAGHHFYHHYDPKHWAHTAQAASRLSHALPGIYTDLDAALSALVKNVPDDATILIVSVHGIEANYSGNHLMPAVLAKLGFQANANAATSESRRSLHAFKRFVPDRVKAAVNAYLLPDSFHDRVRSRTFSRSIDWDKTRAFFIPSDQFQGFISINLKDREPYGTIRPGREYEELCGQICYELGRLTNPQSGKPALREVVQTAKLYGFDSLSALPDIVLCWSKDGPINQLFHPSFGAIEGHTAALRRTQHSGYGFLIAAGAHTNKDGGPAQATILDLAPTILYLLGQPVPSDMDGRVLLELIDEDYRIRHPVQYGQGSGAAAEPTLASKKRQP